MPPFGGSRVLVVAAHPDDETIGAGVYLSRVREPIFVHVTDGAPRDLRDTIANGFERREDYAAARHRELLEALRTGGIVSMQMISPFCADQEASWNLVRITHELLLLIRQFEVDTVLVHPYEGGHPDHDAAAFAVHAACELLHSASRPPVVEFTSYHSREGRMETGVFLFHDAASETLLRLSEGEQKLKSRMLSCFRTQRATLQQFPLTEERFRPAPAYDFSKPPHAGRLFYENFPWGVSKTQWLVLAKKARQELGLC